MASAAEKKELHYKRGAIMARLTRVSTFVENFVENNGNYFELAERLKKLDFSFTEFEQIQEKIELLEPDNDEHENKREDFERVFYDLKSRLQQLLSEKSSKDSDVSCQSEIIMEEKNKRSAVNSRFSRLELFIESFDKSTGDIRQLHERFEKLDLCFSEFDIIQTKIEFIDKDDTENSELTRTTFENKFFELKSKAHRILTEDSDRFLCDSKLDFSGKETRQIKQEFSSIKLPVLNIPTFCGDYESWLSFHDIFVSLIHNNNGLSTVQKFHYLKSSLKKDAESLVQSLEITNDNYSVAWDLLKNRYENKKLIIRKHVQAIFEIPKVTKESASSLRNLLDCTLKNLRVLKQLGQPTDQWDTLIIFIISNNLDSVTRRDWESTSTKDPTVAELTTFIQQRCQILESIETSDSSKSKFAPSAKHHHQKSSTTLHTTDRTSTTDNNTCKVCDKSHKIFHCYRFLKMTPSERYASIKNVNTCFNCLRDGHGASTCQSSERCRHCKEKHNTLLHFNETSINKSVVSEPSNKSESQQNQAPQSSSNSTSTFHSIDSDHQIRSQVFLATAVVKVVDHRGNDILCRAVLDSASHSNFMTEELAQRLKLKRQKIEKNIGGISESFTNITNKVTTTIKSRFNGFKANLDFCVLKKISNRLPIQAINTKDWKIPDNIQLADPEFEVPNKVDMLIGAEIFMDMLCVGQIKLSDQLPRLQKTTFGWIVSGKVNGFNTEESVHDINCFTYLASDVDEQITRFWNQEEVISDHLFTKEEQRCEDIFQETYSRDTTGRFTVSLPLIGDKCQLGDSKIMALKRFGLLENKLQRFPVLQQTYVTVMNEFLTLGHMTEVKEDETSDIETTYYLPHHAVFKPSSSTTKTRVVFDASAKTTSGVSLNDILMVGPTIQDDLFSIILRFRKYKFIMTADIQKMYRQINVQSSDTHLQRIFWRQNRNEELKTYKLTTVTYGTASAPYLAIKCLAQLAKEEVAKYPEASRVVLSEMYVDDVMTGANSLEEAKEIQQQLISLLRSGGFELHKWCSNHSDLLQDIPIERREMKNILEFSSDDTIKTLGLLFQPESDCFMFKIELEEGSRMVSKRTILSDIARIFDPLGLLGPIITTAKVIMQQLWELKIGWDETIPVSSYTQWMQYREQLQHLNNVKIKRWILPLKYQRIELHCFADASELAFGASIYVRIIDEIGEISNALVCSKSRVAPTRKISIPRLELCAAVLAAKLFEKVHATLQIKFDQCYFWTDSTITLAWIKATSSQYKTFVANRVSEIQRLTNVESWRHVPTKYNPADLISRGSSVIQLLNSDLWWNGPSFLMSHSDMWPTNPDSTVFTPEILEQKSKSTVVVLFNSNDDFKLLTNYSTFTKLQRVTAFCLRFIHNCKHPKELRNKQSLTVKELNNATEVLVRIVQQEAFGKELQQLTKSNQVHIKSKLLKLNVFLDEKNIIRVGGRLQNASVSFSQKHQIVLPAGHTFTKMVITNYHISNLHAGPSALLSVVRDKFWPLNGRNSARQVVHNCVRCFKCKPRSVQHIMGDLPENRVQPARAFINTGVDYCGPFFTKRTTRGATKIKSYIALFVCFATKAIHLELVSDLTTNSFISALKRFMARRGKVSNMYSDNATNFVGANNELKELRDLFLSEQHQHQVQNTLATDNIMWNFIPPRSPHFGGLWEAGVKSAKFHLKRVLGATILTFEDLNTVIIQIEACLNSRPIMSMSSDPNDLGALTPGHFLIGDSLVATVEPDLQLVQENRLSRFQKIQHTYQHFWNRWSKEYLPQLQERSKWKTQQHNIQINTLVLIKDDNLPPLQWSLGRVTALHSGQDNVIRVVTLKTSNGLFKRAVAKLCPLPIATDDITSSLNRPFNAGVNV